MRNVKNIFEAWLHKGSWEDAMTTTVQKRKEKFGKITSTEQECARTGDQTVKSYYM